MEKVNIKYRSDIEWLKKRANSKLHLPRTRRRAQTTLNEILVSRDRLRRYATEASEWREKVGGATYQMSGRTALDMATLGVVRRLGGLVKITDEDYLGP